MVQTSARKHPASWSFSPSTAITRPQLLTPALQRRRTSVQSTCLMKSIESVTGGNERSSEEVMRFTQRTQQTKAPDEGAMAVIYWG